jgi:hypothetical protein
MAFNRKQKLRDNIEAIRAAFILDRENRTATTEERAILQRYCGFGGLKCILNPAKELTDAVRWAKSDLELFAPTVELHRLIRENSKDETEYKRFVDSLKASVLTAFYTPKEITDTIADVLADYSVRPARMLEPSAGVGVFVDSMLRHSPNADVMAFEKDLLTGTILRHLYPDQKMRTCGFEKIERPFNNYFDLAVSNIPFGEQADDTAFIRERADRAAETYERARLEGYPADGAQELAMDTLLRGLHYSRYAILREVVENEFADEVPEEKREAFVLKLLPLVGNVFSVYDLSDDNFALSSDYDLLYTELTGATVLYLDEYGV